jgi:epoxyqueuosine reductase
MTQVVQQAARDAGFQLAGIAPVRDFDELNYFPEWIAAGRAGEMSYLEARDDAGHLKRASLRHTAPLARSVIVCAINYNTEHPYSTQVHDPDRGWISRYAWSREDYHDAVMRRLREVEGKLLLAVQPEMKIQSEQEQPHSAPPDSAPPDPAAQVQSSAETVRAAQRFSAAFTEPSSPAALAPEVPAAKEQIVTRCYVDTGPLVERVYAKYAGVGWIGKNTCIINQQIGSWLFLGVILTSLELTPDMPAPDRCGTCTRCIEACPTDALIAPYQLDSNLCISYLTIEKRGEIPEEMRAGLGRHVFGCDICQDVCPWNRKAPVTAAPEFQPRDGLVNPALAWLAEMSAEEFRGKFRGSPMRRTKRAGLRRNAILAMGNSGSRKFVPLLENLSTDDDPVVVESARWALAEIEKGVPGREPSKASDSSSEANRAAMASPSRDSI